MLAKAKAQKEAQEERYRAAKQAAENAMQQRRKAEALLQRYETDLPVQQRQLQERRAQYESELSERKLSEAEWKALAGIYRREQEEPFRAQIDAYTRRYAAAEKLAAAAKEAIGERPQPDMEVIRAQMAETERRLQNVQKRQEQVQQLYRENAAVLSELLPKLTKRQQLVEEHARARYSVSDGIRKCQWCPDGSGNLCTAVLSGKDSAVCQPQILRNVCRPV